MKNDKSEEQFESIMEKETFLLVGRFDGGMKDGRGFFGYQVLKMDGEVIRQGKGICNAITSNQAEYWALRNLLGALKEKKLDQSTPILIQGDSQLIIRQCLQQYRC